MKLSLLFACLVCALSLSSVRLVAAQTGDGALAVPAGAGPFDQKTSDDANTLMTDMQNSPAGTISPQWEHDALQTFDDMVTSPGYQSMMQANGNGALAQQQASGVTQVEQQTGEPAGPAAGYMAVPYGSQQPAAAAQSAPQQPGYYGSDDTANQQAEAARAQQIMDDAQFLEMGVAPKKAAAAAVRPAVSQVTHATLSSLVAKRFHATTPQCYPQCTLTGLQFYGISAHQCKNAAACKKHVLDAARAKVKTCAQQCSKTVHASKTQPKDTSAHAKIARLSATISKLHKTVATHAKTLNTHAAALNKNIQRVVSPSKSVKKFL